MRGHASPEIIGNPSRLLHPLVRDRRSDEFRRASWEEALGRIAESMAASPPDATALWPGHGTFATNYGTRINAQVFARFANFQGGQFFSPTMVCWGLGAFGLALTGIPETHTKEDLGEHANLVVLWGANFTSQPNTARHVGEARARGAQVIAIDVRHTEACAKADEALIIRPGSDTALALAMMNVLCGEGLVHRDFVERHTTGYDALRDHVRQYTPQWAADLTGVPAERIVALPYESLRIAALATILVPTLLGTWRSVAVYGRDRRGRRTALPLDDDPLSVSRSAWSAPLVRAFTEAARIVGYSRRPDDDCCFRRLRRRSRPRRPCRTRTSVHPGCDRAS